MFGNSSLQCNSVCKHNNQNVCTNMFRPKNSYFPERWQNIISLNDTLGWRVFVPIWSKAYSGIISGDLSWDGMIFRKMCEWWWIIYARFQLHVAIQNIPNMPCGPCSPLWRSVECWMNIFHIISHLSELHLANAVCLHCIINSSRKMGITTYCTHKQRGK